MKSNIAVIGAAGKMGRGIALILLQRLALQEAETRGTIGEKARLHLVDLDIESLYELTRYFRPHLTRFAEKSINALRQAFSSRDDLIENGEMIEAFALGALSLLRPTDSLKHLSDVELVFEVIIEDFDAKVELFRQLKEECPDNAYFLSNTSSIPIGELAEASGLQGRLAGAHFYNPPPVQELLELIFPDTVDPQLKALCEEITAQLGKTAVVSRDVAGFIGNGHFLKEVDAACRLYERLKEKDSHIHAILMVESVTRDFLIRPMGLFQLVDYVGLDVVKSIAHIMELPFPPFLQKMVEKGQLGGQALDGSQRPGIFRYEKGRIAAVFDPDTGRYIETTEDAPAVPFPEGHLPWKQMKTHPDQIDRYEKELDAADSPEAQLARQFLATSREIAQNLVDEKVSRSLSDVHTVLKKGFYHLLV